MVLADPAPKTSVAADTEGGIYFSIIMIIAIAILAIVFEPKAVAAVVAPVGQSFASPALAFVHGIYNFFMALFTGIVNKILGGITSVGSSISSGASSLYSNTIGRL